MLFPSLFPFMKKLFHIMHIFHCFLAHKVPSPDDNVYVYKYQYLYELKIYRYLNDDLVNAII